MGFPLSTFQQLAGLCKDVPYIRRKFEQFRLIAIIVHDPSDDSFKRHIKYNFEHLHTVTDEHFAFITFINPPTSWSSAHRGWMETRERLSAGDNCEDAEFVHVLKKRLDLPDGPCIVLTDNLLSDRYVILTTSKEEVIPQMHALSVRVNSCSAPFPINDRGFISFLSTLGQSFEEQTDGESLAKNIADLVAVRSLSGAGAAKDRLALQMQVEETGIYVQERISQLRQTVEDLRKLNNEEQTLDQLEKFSDYLALVLGEIRSDDRINTEYSLDLKEFEGLESPSRNYLSYYNRLLPLYFRPEHYTSYNFLDIDIFSSDDFSLDYSPLGNYLGKAIEEEMNASIVQKIRSLKGVHMPDFYRKYEKGVKCCISTPKKRIYLNRKGQRHSESTFSDLSVPIGDVGYILDVCAQRQMPLPLIEEAFIDRTKKLAILRNQACHTGLFTLNTFDTMYSVFQEAKERDIPRMIQIKKALLNG